MPTEPYSLKMLRNGQSSMLWLVEKQFNFIVVILTPPKTLQDDSSARPSKRKSMDEEICEDAAKRLRPSSPSKPSNSEESPSKDSAVACAQLSNKIMLKRKDDNEPVFHEAPKRSRKSRSLVRSEGDSIPEKQ